MRDANAHAARRTQRRGETNFDEPTGTRLPAIFLGRHGPSCGRCGDLVTIFYICAGLHRDLRTRLRGSLTAPSDSAEGEKEQGYDKVPSLCSFSKIPELETAETGSILCLDNQQPRCSCAPLPRRPGAQHKKVQMDVNAAASAVLWLRLCSQSCSNCPSPAPPRGVQGARSWTRAI